MPTKAQLEIEDEGTPLTTAEELQKVRDHRPPPAIGGMGVDVMGGHPVRHARHEKLPPGFIRHREGSKCPYPDRARVELMIRTSGGIGSSGITPVFAHDWEIAPDDIGGVVGYRLLETSEPNPARPEHAAPKA